MRNFIRYFLILTFLCVLPVFVWADETDTDSVAIEVTKNLLTGSTDGVFYFKLTDQKGNVVSVTDQDGNVISGDNGIDLPTVNGTVTKTIYGLSPNTDYIIEEINIPSTHKFVSIKSEDKIITNAQKINIKTGDAGTVTEVTITNASNITSGIEHNKDIESNNDGTHKLSLSVTGRADTTTTSTKANIIIVYDVSSSMVSKDYDSYYEETGKYENSGKYYGYRITENKDSNGDVISQTGEFQVITQSDGVWTFSDGTIYNNGNDKLGKLYRLRNRYSTDNNGNYNYEDLPTRASSAERVTRNFINRLLANNNGSTDPNVQLSLVTFQTYARVFDPEHNEFKASNVYPTYPWTRNTTEEGNLKGVFGRDDASEIAYNTSLYTGKTNWEKALKDAKKILDSNSTDGDPTYIVFITDGQPTAVGTGSSASTTSAFEAAKDDILALKNDSKVKNIFGVFAFGKEEDYLDDLIYYANHDGTPRPNSQGGENGATVLSTTDYYNAIDETALQAAIDNIFDKIVNTAGFGNVSINDGTTSQVHVQTSTGDMSTLLNVDDGSFKYWLSMSVENASSDNHQWKFKMTDRVSGSDYWVYLDITDYNATATWTLGGTEYSATLPNCSVEDGIFKYEWEAGYTGDDSFYAKEPPEASYEDGAIKWDLASVGTLLNNVTYTVTVDVWPTQYTNDLIVDLTNGTITYDSLPDNVRDYIEEKNGTYKLRTNTEALVTYTDSRNESGPQTATFNNPDGVATPKDNVTVEKQWENTLDPGVHGSNEFEKIDVNLLKNGTVHEKITLTNANDWRNSIFISPGIMKTIDGKFISLETGNKYTFKEDKFYPKAGVSGDGYHWDLKADTIRPMLINGESVMLIMVDETSKTYLDNPLTDEEKGVLDTVHFLEKGSDKYYKICTINKEDSTETCLDEIYKVGNPIVLLTNYRRNYLNITKEIVDENDTVIENQVEDEFIFALTVTDPNGDDVYFSTWDNKNSVTITNNIISGVVSTTPTDTGYYIIHSGDTVTLKLKNKWNVRFINLPNGATYTFSEVLNSQSPAGYVFSYVTITPSDSSERITDSLLENQLIDRNNTSYQITYYNHYESTSITVNKIWSVAADAINIDIINNSKVATIEIVDANNLNDESTTRTIDLTESNNTKTWNDLPKCRYDANGICKDITYIAREIQVGGIDSTIENGIQKFYIIDSRTHAIIGAWVLSKSDDQLTLTNTWEAKPVGQVNLKKVAFGDLSGLSGAVFVLYRYIGEGNPADEVIDLNDSNLDDNWVLIGQTTSNPMVIFNNLYKGTYRLIEISVPGNYILPEGQWEVSVSENTNGTTTVSYRGINNPPNIGEDNLIYNQPIPEMPVTGGFGIYEISLIGLFLMMIGTIAFAISQRKLI